MTNIPKLTFEYINGALPYGKANSYKGTASLTGNAGAFDVKLHYRLTIGKQDDEAKVRLSWYTGDKSFDVTEASEPDKIEDLFFDASEEGAEEAHKALCEIYEKSIEKNKRSDS